MNKELHVKLYCMPHTEEKLLVETSQLPLLQCQGDVVGYRVMETGTPLQTSLHPKKSLKVFS